MSPTTRIAAQLNPFMWPEAEPLLAGDRAHTPTDVAAMQWATQTLVAPSAATVAARYRQLPNDSMVFPYLSVLRVKVAIPIAQAKIAFAFGHEVSCIALTAFVAEMMTLFRLAAHGVTRDTPALSADSRKSIDSASGNLDEVAQGRRISILSELGLVSDDLAKKLKRLKQIRNDYLHSLQKPHENISLDAIEAYRLAIEVTKGLLGYQIRDGNLLLNAEVRAYLEKLGIRSEPGQ